MASDQTQREQVRALNQIASELHRNGITADELRQVRGNIAQLAESLAVLRATVNDLGERVLQAEHQTVKAMFSEE